MVFAVMTTAICGPIIPNENDPNITAKNTVSNVSAVIDPLLIIKVPTLEFNKNKWLQYNNSIYEKADP